MRGEGEKKKMRLNIHNRERWCGFSGLGCMVGGQKGCLPEWAVRTVEERLL
jgi:hypothetical protein